MTEKTKQYDDEGRVIRENRSQLKRERDEIKDFARELLSLPGKQYPLLPINATLIAALNEGKRLSGNALKRHMNYLTRLLDEQDAEAIRLAHTHVNQPYLNDGQKNQRILSEIERLLNNDEEIVGDLFARYADLDLQYVRQLTREAQKTREQQAQTEEGISTKPGKHQRRLQKYLQSLALNYDPDA